MEALNFLEQGEFDFAATVYREILQRFPNDPVAKAMLRDLFPNLQPEMRIRNRQVKLADLAYCLRLCLSQIKPGHIGDAVRPGLGDKECARRDRRRARPVHLSPGIDACGPHCNISCTTAVGDGGGAR